MLIVLCGPAGAGKTSIAKRLMEELDDAYLISSDGFRRRVYDRVIGEVGAWQGEHKYLVVDATFYRRMWRERLMDAVGDACGVMTVFVDCSLETCLERNRGREAPIPDGAVHIIWREFERPVNPDVYIDTNETSLGGAMEKILGELGNREKKEKRQGCLL